MNEIEDMLGKILSSPEEMEKLGKMASELFGGGAEEAPKKGAAQTDKMPDIGKMLGSLMGGGKGNGGDKAALVAALGPYLKPERRRRLEKALKISRLAGIAEIAMQGLGDGDV